MSEDFIHQSVRWSDAALLEPEHHVRLAAHGTDLDLLLHTKPVGGHTGIDLVSQFDVILLVGLDDGGSVYARGSAKGVVTYDGIVGRNRHAKGLGHGVGIVLELAQVTISPSWGAHQFEVHHHLVHG